MIQHENGVFLLKTEHYSYLFRIHAGLPEHLHFGAPLELSDAEALAVKPGLGWGESVICDEVCQDVLPLEWSVTGRGDYREPPFLLEQDAQPAFRYVRHSIIEGCFPALMPSAKEGQETLLVVFEAEGMELTLAYTVFETALTRRILLKNTSKEPVILRRLMSSCVDLFGSYEMTTFDGAWIAETHRHTVPVGRARVVNESTTGFSSHRHNPAFLLSAPGATEESGVVYGFNLIWSGNHYASAQRSHQGLTRVMQGVGDFVRLMLPGERIETPESVLCWSDQGFNGLSHKMHDFVNDHIIPSHWRHRPRPVLYNNWEGCGFDFDQSRLLGLAKQATDLGCELFVLDDGWFGARNSDKAGLGDYTVNRKKLPDGLDLLAKQLKELGLDFGLWFEPEGVNPDSDLYRAHPDWVLGTDGLLSRNEYLLDLTLPEVRDYIVSSVGGILDSADIKYVKWDMNRHSTALGRKAYDYIIGLYEVLDRIFTPRPEILLEGCSSGGNRFDLGMLLFAPQIWASDDTDPIERLEIQQGLSYCYPLSTMGAHVSAAPHAQTLRTTPLPTRGNVASFGILGYELDLAHLLPVEETEIKTQIETYKAHRETFQFGRFSRIPSEGAVSWQVATDTEAIVGLFHGTVEAAPPYQRLRALGLKGEQEIGSRPQLLRVGSFGGLLKHVAPVPLNPNGLLVRTADRHYRMSDGQEHFFATGEALNSGVMLAPRFSGTGYDPAARLQGDFCSNLYIIKEAPHEQTTGHEE